MFHPLDRSCLQAGPELGLAFLIAPGSFTVTRNLPVNCVTTRPGLCVLTCPARAYLTVTPKRKATKPLLPGNSEGSMWAWSRISNRTAKCRAAQTFTPPPRLNPVA